MAALTRSSQRASGEDHGLTCHSGSQFALLYFRLLVKPALLRLGRSLWRRCQRVFNEPEEKPYACHHEGQTRHHRRRHRRLPADGGSSCHDAGSHLPRDTCFCHRTRVLVLVLVYHRSFYFTPRRNDQGVVRARPWLKRTGIAVISIKSCGHRFFSGFFGDRQPAPSLKEAIGNVASPNTSPSGLYHLHRRTPEGTSVRGHGESSDDLFIAFRSS